MILDYKFINRNLTPKEIASLSEDERSSLCKEIRDKILNVVSRNGGHLASNLGVVEMTVALLSVFDYTEDQIIFDVGHQSYAYKILTGRYEAFDTLRKKDGISGFPRRSESPYDVFDTGHSATSVSAAVGIARANELNDKNNHVIAVIGDGAMTGGPAYEAINDLGHRKDRVIVILNDNEMSIKSSAPISNRRIRSLVESSLDSIITGICLKSSFCLIHSKKSSPLIPGIRISEIIRSGVLPA